MKTVKLLCAAGTSTQILAQKVQETADNLGLEMDVKAASVSGSDDACKDADLLLLTPQVAFKLDVVKMTFPDKKIDVIDANAFATLDTQAIIAQINKELQSPRLPGGPRAFSSLVLGLRPAESLRRGPGTLALRA